MQAGEQRIRRAVLGHTVSMSVWAQCSCRIVQQVQAASYTEQDNRCGCIGGQVHMGSHPEDFMVRVFSTQKAGPQHQEDQRHQYQRHKRGNHPSKEDRAQAR